jgi:hypothetical protein
MSGLFLSFFVLKGAFNFQGVVLQILSENFVPDLDGPLPTFNY